MSDADILDAEEVHQYTNWDMLVARSRENWRLLSLSIAMLLIISVIGWGMFGAEGNETAPDFTAQWVDGEEFELKELRGKTVVLDIMSSTCAPCKDIAEDVLTPIHEQRKDDDSVLIISVSVEDTEESLRQYAADSGYEWPHALDINSTVFKNYDAMQIPKVLVIDDEGRIIFHEQSNSIPKEDVDAAIDAAKSGSASVVNLKQNSIFFMAIGAGVLSFFSPCSFPLLPGYVSFYLARKSDVDGGISEKTIRKALPAGLAAAAGILSVFLAIALIALLFSQAIKGYVPLLIPITAAIILVMGLIMIIDYDYSWFSRPLKDNSNKFIAKISPLVVVPVTAVIRIMKRDKDFNFNSELQGEGLWGQFGYGVGYGAASAGCTAPIFIALLFASMEYSFLGAAFIFTLYAFSTAALMVSFTVLVAASQNTLVNRMKASTGQIKKVGGVVLLLVGAYLMYEYFTTWAL